MMGLTLPHLILFGVVFLVLFGGRNKISEIMGDVAKGIQSFKKGLSDDPDQKPQPQPRPADPVRTIDHQQQAHSETTSEPRKVG